MKFLTDKNCAYLALHLRELGYDAISVMDFKRDAARRNSGEARLWKDSSVRRLAEREDRILITADWGLAKACRKLGTKYFLIKNHKGIIGKLEQAMIIVAHFDHVTFQSWLTSGKTHWCKILKYEGNWNEIKKEARYYQKNIDQVEKYDPLGYPLITIKA